MLVTDRHNISFHDEEQLGDPSTVSLIMVGVVGTILVLAIVFALQGLFYKEEYEENRRKVYDVSFFEARDLKNEQTNRLKTWSWIDRESNAVQMPIAEAMKIAVGDLKNGWIPMTPEQANAAIAAAAAREREKEQQAGK